MKPPHTTNKSVDRLSNNLIDVLKYIVIIVTSPIVIKVPTRGLLAVETKNSFVLWLAKFEYQDLFVNSEYRYIPAAKGL